MSKESDELRRKAAALLREADIAESRECTGVAARWCPVCGTCTCLDQDGYHSGHDGFDCPLHGRDSTHADARLIAMGIDPSPRIP